MKVRVMEAGRWMVLDETITVLATFRQQLPTPLLPPMPLSTPRGWPGDGVPGQCGSGRRSIDLWIQVQPGGEFEGWSTGEHGKGEGRKGGREGFFGSLDWLQMSCRVCLNSLKEAKIDLAR